MATLNLVKTGVHTIIPTDTSPVDIALPGDAVKLASAYPLVQVRETRLGSELGATAYLFDASTLRIEFKVTPLPAGEEIVVRWYVFDIENLGDEIKEVLFRLQGILGYLGENLVQDLITSDQSGNITQYRMRVFDSKANAENAVLNKVDGSPLDMGEQRRVTVTQNVIKAKNTRSTMRKVLDLILSPTPGVD